MAQGRPEGNPASRVEVTDAEIDSAYSKLISSVDKKQYLVAEIFLPVDSPTDDTRVKAFADNLEEQLHQGANFAKLAQQFSQAAGAAQGGDLGSVQDGELPDELDQKLKTMTAGTISDPVRTQAGYHILSSCGRRAMRCKATPTRPRST